MTDQPDPELNKAHAAAALTPPARRLHLTILEAFATTGTPPSRVAIEQLARDFGADPTELAERDLVAFDQRGEVRPPTRSRRHPRRTG